MPVTEDQKRFDPFGSPLNLWEVFDYHPLDEDAAGRVKILRTAAVEFAIVLKNCVPACADRTAALRHLRECVMTANGAISLRGRI